MFMNVNDMFETYNILRFKPFKLDDDKGCEFREGEVVHVEYTKTENYVKDSFTCLGRIEYIDTSFLEIDCSEQFHKNIITINFDDIEYIEHRFEGK